MEPQPRCRAFTQRDADCGCSCSARAAATCLPSRSSAWAFPTESEINKAVNNPFPVRLKDRRALDRDSGRCRATRGPANFVPLSGTETAERRVPDRKEWLNLQGLTLQGIPNLPPPCANKNGGRSLPWLLPALPYCGPCQRPPTLTACSCLPISTESGLCSFSGPLWTHPQTWLLEDADL